MSGPIEFFFDFSSPYGYFASFKVDELAERYGRQSVWKPFMLGVVFKETGNRPLSQQPLKGEYCIHDWERLGRYMNVPWTMPDPFPIATLSAARAFYWLDGRDSDQAKRFAVAAFDAYFGQGRDISTVDAVVEIAAGLGEDAAEVKQSVTDAAIKQRLKEETAAAMERGVIGSPYFIVDGEGFWGSDRMWMIKKWLQDGGW